jgi:DNA-binding NarL/FixJ family response regulator
MAHTPIRLICIDDDPLALDQLKLVLGKIDAPLCCEYFGSPAQALRAHREKPADMVISDLRMGTTTGVKLVAEMQSFAQDTIYMLISGDADLNAALAAMNEARVFRFFIKPASAHDLKAGIGEAICELNLRRMRNIAASTLDTFERFNAAVASVSVDGKIQYANAPANRIFRESGYFEISPEDELRSVNPGETKGFLKFLANLAQSKEDSAARSVFRFNHPEHQRPIVVSGVFFSAEGGQAPHISLVISDPARRTIASAEEIATALNLPPSEARVVHGLVAGGSVEDAAAIAGVSLSTARTYLKNVFGRTGVSRQAELVRLVLLTAA